MPTIEVLRVDGTKQTVESPCRGLLTTVYRLIKCELIDTVNLRDGRVMLVDDTGAIDGKPVNEQATQLYHSVCRPGTTNPICGDVAICVDADFA